MSAVRLGTFRINFPLWIASLCVRVRLQWCFLRASRLTFGETYANIEDVEEEPGATTSPFHQAVLATGSWGKVRGFCPPGYKSVLSVLPLLLP
jgi:hypothetical protein